MAVIESAISAELDEQNEILERLTERLSEFRVPRVNCGTMSGDGEGLPV